jgi:bifunctional non-homologous end joining protein LigD
MTIRISNPERVLFPDDGITKAELAAHVERFAGRTLPHVEGRPLTLERYPKGIAETGFMQKNMPKGLPGVVERCAVPKRNGETVHPMVNTREGLAYLANLAAISLHAPTARCEDVWRPDRIVFDLDPPPGDTSVADAARMSRTFLGDLGLATVPLATGSKGYHLVAFISRGPDSAVIAHAARGAAELMARAAPSTFTMSFKKVDRRGRIFLDWLRNAVPATSIVPYSLRARPGAPMATPLSWDELVGPADVTLRSAPTRLGLPDPWAPAMASPIDVRPFIENVASAISDAGIELTPFDRFRT